MRFTRVLVSTVIFTTLFAIPARAANSIAIESKYATPCTKTSIGIFIENDVDLKRISLPLVIRSLDFESFWADSVDTVPTGGRLATTLVGNRIFERGRVDYASPDQVALIYEAGALGADCLPAGPSQLMAGLRFKTNASFTMFGSFEIDTMAYAPCFALELLRCSDGASVPLTMFSKGMISIVHGGEPLLHFAADSIIGTAGNSLQNQCLGMDPEGDPLGIRQVSGPGQINPLTWKWSWASCTRDTGSFVVTAEVYEKVGCGLGFPASFVVRVNPQDKADVNCDGIADVFDLVAQIDYIFGGKPLPPCP